MPTIIWIVLGVIALGALFGGKGKGKQPAGGTVRIDHPHLIDHDDYECPVCRYRFPMNVMFCPNCGARFSGNVADEKELEDDEEELDAWDEEDGL